MSTTGMTSALEEMRAKRRLVGDGAYEYLSASGSAHSQTTVALYVRRRNDERITITAEGMVRDSQPGAGTRNVAAIVMDRETAGALIGELARLLAEHPERSDR